MQIHDALTIADHAVSAAHDRPATAIISDSTDARSLVFRIDAGQTVPMHTSTSSVILSVMKGVGIISGPVNGVVEEREVGVGTIVTYEPNESHGMRALTGTFVVVATIAPRPGTPRGIQPS